MSQHRQRFADQLQPETAKAFEAAGRRRDYERGSIVFLEGQTTTEVLLIESGLFSVRKSSVDGREVSIATRGPGDLIGEMSAIEAKPRTAAVRAVADGWVLAIPGDAFMELASRHPDCALALIRQLASRVRESSQQLLELAAHDGMSRVCGRLVAMVEDREQLRSPAAVGSTGDGSPGESESEREGEAEGDAVTVRIGSQEELGAAVGLQRAAVVKLLRRMKRLGWVDTERGVVHIHDLSSLRLRAGVPGPT